MTSKAKTTDETELVNAAVKSWTKLAEEAAPLGRLAIHEQMLKIADQFGVEVPYLLVVPCKDKPDTFAVVITFVAMAFDGRRQKQSVFTVRNPSIEFGNYRDTEDFIRGRQEPATLKHNASEFIYTKIVELVRKATQYEVAKGDLWAHVHDTLEGAQGQEYHEGLVSFGAVTYAGMIAMRKYKAVRDSADNPT